MLARLVFFLPIPHLPAAHVPETSYFGFRTQDESLSDAGLWIGYPAHCKTSMGKLEHS